MPADQYHREIDYLRVSVTDHCNLRCVYCMPLTGLQFAPHHELLTAEEIELVVSAAAQVGFRKVRVTGGEPTLRLDIIDIIKGIARTPGIRDVSITTNGILLPALIKPLMEAGLSRVNIHLDTLNPKRLNRIMRYGTFEQIWTGIEAADAAGLHPIKINAVVTAGYNERDVVDLAALSLERNWHIRFIELMPLGGGECAKLSRSRFVASSESRRRIEAALGPLIPVANVNPSDESQNYRLKNGQGIIGFISPVSEPYCGNCSRMRLTADGKLHLCLLNDDEMDLKKALREGGGTEAVARVLLKAVQFKPVGHKLRSGVSSEARAMFQLGG